MNVNYWSSLVAFYKGDRYGKRGLQWPCSNPGNHTGIPVVKLTVTDKIRQLLVLIRRDTERLYTTEIVNPNRKRSSRQTESLI